MEKWQPLLEVDFRISNRCCNVMKKQPLHDYQKKTGRDRPFIGTMAEESRMRMQAWMRTGCNAFDSRSPHSTPLAFWTEQDILQFIKDNNIKISDIYGDIVYADEDGNEYAETLVPNCKLKTTGCSRSGCIYCLYGISHDKGLNRLERLKITHPRQYEYCLDGGGYDEEGMWIPTKQGLGLAHVIDELNKIYGKDFIRY